MAGMKNVLKQIPKGWELVPVGCVVRAGHMVCCNPHTKWETMGFDAGRVRKSGDPMPYGYYIRKKRVKARK